MCMLPGVEMRAILYDVPQEQVQVGCAGGACPVSAFFACASYRCKLLSAGHYTTQAARR